ncbi:hypothetical protein CDEN61S_02675 [Castellaniella denitrificans]
MGRLVQPGVRIARQDGILVPGPVASAAARRGIDDPRDVAGLAQHEAQRPAQQPRRGVGRGPGHDVVFARGVQIGRHVQGAQVDRRAADAQLAGLEAVFQVGVAEIPGEERSRQIGAVGVPGQQVEGPGRLAHQIVGADVVPHQFRGPQEGEGGGQLARRHQAARAQLLLARTGMLFVDEDVEDAGLAEIQEGGQQGQRGHRVLVPGARHGQGAGKQRAPHAEAQGVDLRLAGHLAHDLDGPQHTVLDVVVPGLEVDAVLVLRERIAPGHHEDLEPGLHGVQHQGIGRLQVQDVVLVDAGRHHQQGPAADLFRLRPVLDELHQGVFVDHRPRGDGQVLARHEGGFVGLRDAAPRQVAHQVRQPPLQGFAAAVDQGLLGVGIGRQEVGRRSGLDPLHDRELQALARGVFAIGGLREAPQGVGHDEVGVRREQGLGIADPGVRREAAVGGWRQRALPEPIQQRLPGLDEI